MGPQGERSSSSFSTITQSRHLVWRGPRRPSPTPPPGAGLRRQSRRSNGGYFDPSLRLPRLVPAGMGPQGERSSSSFSTITQSRHLVGGGPDGPPPHPPPEQGCSGKASGGTEVT